MNLDKIKCIFSTVRLLADNAHGGITGVHGSVNPRAVAAIFRAMDIFGSNFVDAGAGDGKLMACASPPAPLKLWAMNFQKMTLIGLSLPL
jgi:hypothetical protein